MASEEIGMASAYQTTHINPSSLRIHIFYLAIPNSDIMVWRWL